MSETKGAIKRTTINHELAIEVREKDGKLEHVALVLAGYSRAQTLKAVERAREKLKSYPHEVKLVEICVRPKIAQAMNQAIAKRRRDRTKPESS